MEDVDIEEIKQQEKKNKTRHLLFDYFYNKKYVIFLSFLLVYCLLNLLKLLEQFHWLDLLSYMIPVFIIVGLSNFYSEMKYKDTSNQSLNISISAINIQMIISFVSMAIFVIVLLPLIKPLSIIMVISVGLMVINLQSLYYTSRCLSLVKDIIDSGNINVRSNQYYFSKAYSKWITSGIINAVVYLLSLVREENGNTNKLDCNYKKLISLGAFSKAVEILIIGIGLIYPFVISYVLNRTKLGLDRIHTDIINI